MKRVNLTELIWGVAYRMISEDLAQQTELPEGAYIQTVVAGSAADEAGLQEGDIITEIDGQALRSGEQELASVISRKKIGDTVRLTIYRQDTEENGRTIEAEVVLGATPEQ